MGLTLKAFLVSQGCTDQQLRGVGHDLNSGLRSAERHKSFTRSPISADDRLIIELINDYYSRREFESVFLGFKSFRNPDAVRTLCELVHQNVKAVIWQAVHRQISAPPPKTP